MNSQMRVGQRVLRASVLRGALAILIGLAAVVPTRVRAQVVTSDVTHFWEAFDAAAKVPPPARVAVYQREYVDRASPGLRDFLDERRITTQALAQHVEANRSYYAQVRPYIGQVVDQKAVIDAALRRLRALIPGVKYPGHIYFVVGPQRGAGMSSPRGVIFAAEMFATPPGTPYDYHKAYPNDLPFAAVHETIHFNQAFQADEHATLLQLAITEGTADFIASLALQEPNQRQYTDRWQYGCPHEAALNAQFAGEEDSVGTGPWMYNAKPATGWPPDMGYWLGYRIDQAYYDRASDKRAALRTLLGVTDFHAFLRSSGYPATRSACRPQTPVTLKTP